jgi:hypothetical protein
MSATWRSAPCGTSPAAACPSFTAPFFPASDKLWTPGPAGWDRTSTVFSAAAQRRLGQNRARLVLRRRPVDRQHLRLAREPLRRQLVAVLEQRHCGVGYGQEDL